MAASDDGLYLLDSQQKKFTPLAIHLGQAWDIARSGGNTIAATRNRVQRIIDGRADVLYTGQSDIFVIEPSRRESGHFLLSEGRTIRRLAPDGATRILATDLPDIATSIAEDDDGHLWLGTTSRGILRVTPQGTVSDRAASATLGLPAFGGPATALATTDGDVLLFSTTGAWIKPHGATTFHPVADFPHRETLALSPTRDRTNIWLTLAEAGGRPPVVGQVVIAHQQASWRPHAVEGLGTIGTPRSLFAERIGSTDTILWIGGATGILRNEVRGGPSAPVPQTPLLRVAAQREDSREPFPIVAPLPYSTESITFEFASPQFAIRPSLRLETRIDGIDREWVPGGPTSRRELTALRDGRYRFQVRAVAETGVASTPAVFDFEVRPPWWRTLPAMACAVLALAPLGYGLYRLRIRTLRQRNAELEQKVRQRTQELEAANAAKTQFVANMSHDIRNPLNGIVGLSLALEDTRLDARQREIIATLRECTTYLSSLVDDVLDFASIEAGRVELRPGPFAPQELLRSIVVTLRTSATESGALLTVEADENLPANLLGDAGRIQQILVNFVSNALKYAGGSVRLSARAPADSPGEIEFAVNDEGPGISAEEQTKLFTKFSRLKQTRGGEEIPGAGLGLASCRLLADIMGGSVGVESNVGCGARFFLRLPLVVATTPAATSALHLPNTTVLLVEDTDYNAWAASAVLAKLGLTCERARTGTEALQLFEQKRFNVVLLDRNLPDMDGTEVARRMRAMESDGLQAVLLAVTAYCTAEDRALCLQAGMDAFVGKPLTLEKLRKVLLDTGSRLLTTASVHMSPEPSAMELDLALLTYLSDGSAEGLEAQINRFLTSLDESETQMMAACTTGDLIALGAEAHRVLGQARMIGATALAETASRLEAAARTSTADDCAGLLRRVRDEILIVTEAVRRRHPAVPST